MTAATPSRIGQINETGDTRALFLKVFSGEVLTTFNAMTVMKDKVRSRTISSGKSAQFPTIGKTVAAYHTPGAELVGDTIKHDEKVITIDDLLVSSTFVSRIDEAMSHFEVRSEYSKQMGQALAQTYDRNLLSMAVKAARDPSGLGLGAADFGNAVSTNIGASPTVQDIVDAIYAAAQALDEKNVPESDRFCFVSPATYWDLVTNDKLINRDFGGANGVYSDGKVWNVAGIQIVKTNNLAVDHTTDTVDYGTKYQVDASTTAAVIMHPSAMGTVKLMDLSSEMEWDIRRQGTLMVSKMAVGHGILRPECIYELNKSA